MYYGITRDSEVILSDYNAPDNWRNQNPTHNGSLNVDWDGATDIHDVGGSSHSYSEEVTTTEKRTHSFEMEVNMEEWSKIGIFTQTLNIRLDVRNYVEQSESYTYQTACIIYDDESSDFIDMRAGIDKKFGTYIFNTTTFFCETSYPLEYNTRDYLPPIIEFPYIDLDSNDDGKSPCSDDSPIVTVDIFEEGGIADAYIVYSINNGVNWDTANLTEQIANLGTWEGSVPRQSRGTTVLWYIQAWDNEGYSTIRKNPSDEPYSFTVINSVPSITVISPNGGESYQNVVRIEWFTNDADDDSLSITLAYNLGGVGWYLIAEDISGDYYDWDISNLKFSDSVLVKVIVNDGHGGEAEDTSNFVFTVGKPPSGPSVIPAYSPFVLTFTITITIVAIMIYFKKQLKKDLKSKL